MDFTDSINYVAQCHGKFGRPKRLEEICTEIPYFEIKKNALNRFEISSFGYRGHDNEPRMEYYMEYFKHMVLPNISRDVDICGFYNMEIHDSYTYLDITNREYPIDGLLTFSKKKNDRGPVVIPDPYMVGNWGNMLEHVHDSIPWEQKEDVACFYGTTTGDRNPIRNVRLQFCAKALKVPDTIHAKITKVAQMTNDSIVHAYGRETYNAIYMQHQVHPMQQMKNKVLVCIDGNTSRFDVWNYLTNCLTIKSSSRDMLWYYPLLQDGVHFIKFDANAPISNTADIVKRCCVESENSKRIIKNANIFAQSVFKPLTHVQYMVNVFEEMAENK